MFDLSIETILYRIPAALIALSFHEFGHAMASDRFGDPTPRNQGRLTLSPLAHIDVIGFLFIILAGFGWAKPVQINPRYYKKPRRDDIIVSIAGPLMNLLLAFIFAFLIKALVIMSQNVEFSQAAVSIAINLFNYTIQLNVILMLFNLLPLPPLDGFHILANIVPARSYKFIYMLEQYSTIILILIIVTPAISYILLPPFRLIYRIIMNVAGLL